jgi:UDP-N-acetylmuramate--alanine ligase
MELRDIQRVYLVGIGGIGMSGLARYNEGIQVVFDDKADWIPMSFQEPCNDTLIIYTPAIPKDSAILNYFKNKGFELFKRSQVLGLISKSSFTIAVAGTHGKTTTSTMVAHLLKASGNDCSAFLGGISSNYQSNVLYGKNNVMVVEADEYDRSFLTLYPDVAIITSMDADHLDIYGDHAHLTESFKLFASQIKVGGTLVHKKGLPLDTGYTYAIDDATADAHAANIRIEGGDFYFDFVNAELRISDIKMGIAGTHNIENAVAAIEAVLRLDIPADSIKSALASFKGVKRRFEYIVKTPEHIYIDDYAHHPEELRACISSVKKLYPDKKLTAIFQPHLYTRTRDFADGFAEVLDMVDELILLDIYPARELPIEGVTSDMLLNKMQLVNKRKLTKQQALDAVKNEKPKLLLTVGAGDIDTLVHPLNEILQHG